MNDQSIGDVAKAAHELGFRTINRSHNGFFRFDWWDRMAGTIVECPELPDEKEAFRQACIVLVNYISVPQNVNSIPHDPASN